MESQGERGASEDEIFFDAEEHASDDGSKSPRNQTQENAHDTSKKRCSVLRSLPRRFPRTFALIFQVFLPLYSLIGIAMIFGYFLCRIEGPGEKYANNMALAASHMMDQLARLSEVTINVIPLLCLDAYLATMDGASINQEAYFDTQLFTQNGHITAAQDILNATDFSITSLNITNLTAFRSFIADCGTEKSRQTEELGESIYNNDILAEYIGSEVTFNWVKCPVPDDNSNDEEAVDLTEVVSETFVVYEAGAQLDYAKHRWEMDLNETFAG